MPDCWYEFPDTQKQADAISALKRGADAFGYSVMVFEAPDLGPGVKRASVTGNFADCKELYGHVVSALYLGMARPSRRPDDDNLIPN